MRVIQRERLVQLRRLHVVAQPVCDGSRLLDQGRVELEAMPEDDDSEQVDVCLKQRIDQGGASAIQLAVSARQRTELGENGAQAGFEQAFVTGRNGFNDFGDGVKPAVPRLVGDDQGDEADDRLDRARVVVFAAHPGADVGVDFVGIAPKPVGVVSGRIGKPDQIVGQRFVGIALRGNVAEHSGWTSTLSQKTNS